MRQAPPAPRLDDFGFAELRGGGSRVLIVPALGGKIAHLELAGRQWLWASEVTPYGLPDENASYDETGDTGGYDECFPTVRACKVPTWVRAFGGVPLPDHGEVWSQVPSIDVRTSPDGQTATTTWMGRRMPYRLTRVVRVTPTGDVECEYEATNTGTDRVPFLWSAHPVFPLTSTTRLDLPAVERDERVGQLGPAGQRGRLGEVALRLLRSGRAGGEKKKPDHALHGKALFESLTLRGSSSGRRFRLRESQRPDPSEA